MGGCEEAPQALTSYTVTRELQANWVIPPGLCPVLGRSATTPVPDDFILMLKRVGVDRPGEVSRLLEAWGNGDVAARDRMLPLVYHELRARAQAYLRRERREHTLQPTALVHEAFMRLIGQDRVAWRNRGHFFGVAAEMMRRILVDHARNRLAGKRLGAAVRVTLDDRIGVAQPEAVEVLLLDQALTELARLDPRQGEIVQLRYFAGLSEEEVAAALSLSRTTVKREWHTAKAWLFRRMTKGPRSDS